MTPEEHERETPAEGVPAVRPTLRPSMRPTARPTLAVPPRTKSGQHPAVVAMRAKADSLIDAQAAAHDELDAKLDEAIARLKTPVPPPDVEDLSIEDLSDDTPTSH